MTCDVLSGTLDINSATVMGGNQPTSKSTLPQVNFFSRVRGKVRV